MAADITHDLELIELAARGEVVRDAVVDAMNKICKELQYDMWYPLKTKDGQRLILADEKILCCLKR